MLKLQEGRMLLLALSLSLSGMVQEIHGTYQVQYHPVDDDPDKVESGYRGM